MMKTGFEKVKSKLRSRRGLTLIEMLASLAMMVILSAAILLAVPSSVNIYREMTALSESGSLASVVCSALTDEMRYARNIITDDDKTVLLYYSERYGAGSAFQFENGRVSVIAANGQVYGLLSEKTYTNRLSANVSAKFDGSVFRCEISICGEDSEEVYFTEFSTKPLNQ